MIKPQTIERVKEAADIEDVVRSYNVSLRRRGSSFWANCPFPGHEEKTPSFCVTPAKGICKCFGCGKGGDAVSFVRIMENVNYLDAIKILAKRYNIEIEERSQTEEERKQIEKRETLYAINEFADNWFQQQMWETAEGQDIAWRYFHDRGIREDVARKFHLGYSPNVSKAFYNAAVKAGYSAKLLEELGLCRKSDKYGSYYDFFRGRVMFPIHTIAGRVIAFGGRILEKRDDVGKYYNSIESDDFYVKSRELYGLFQAQGDIRRKDHCYLCEGYMDVIAMHQYGLPDAIASCGTSLTEQQAKRISRLTQNVTILYDGDKAGIKAAIRAIDILLPCKVKINVLVLPDDDDPDSFARKHTTEEYISYIEGNQTDWIEYLIRYAYAETLKDINQISDTLQQFVSRLALIPDEIYRNICIRTVAEKMNFSIDVITKQVDNKRNVSFRSSDFQPAVNIANSQNNLNQQPAGSTSDSATTEVQPLRPKSGNEEFSLDYYAKNILHYLLRYGRCKMFPDTEDNTRVCDYIFEILKQSDITFSNPILQQIYDEYVVICDTDMDVESEFLSHPNQEIQGLAYELLFDEYSLSKFFEIEDTTLPLTTGKNAVQQESIKVRHMPSDADNLPDLVPKVVYEYFVKILDNQIDAIMQQLKEANETQNSELTMQLLGEYSEKQKLRQPMTEYLKKVIL